MVLAVVVLVVTKRGPVYSSFFLPSDFLTPGIERKYYCYNAVRK